ncbi:MAG: leucine dehydrogenase [Firmicutes bacterium]|nr:leucine dehydrogenase [Bacillota bacterium]
MDIFERMAAYGHEQVIFCHDRVTGLRAIVAIHDTTLGPALGGTRMMAYGSEEEALEDALRLSRGMTYKAAAAGLDHGGGKAVIWGDPRTDKSEERFRAFGRMVQTLGGRFITGTDLGTAKEDFVWSRAETPYLVALPEEHGGSGDSGVVTAFGVFQGMLAAAAEVWGEPSLRGRHVAVQGLGKVGARLVDHLVEAGAPVTVTDIAPESLARVRERHPGVEAVPPEAIYDVPADIFSPNALGGVLNDETIPRLRCRIVAGAANNQLAAPRHGRMLMERGILYAPDFVINSGGLIQVADELLGYNRERALRKAAAIYDRLRAIFAISRREGIPTQEAAERLAEERIRRIAALRRIYTPG